MVNSILSAGVQGISSGLEQARKAAEDIAETALQPPSQTGANNPPSSDDGLSNLTSAAVDLKLGELQVKASANVIKTADEIIGTIVDIKA